MPAPLQPLMMYKCLFMSAKITFSSDTSKSMRLDFRFRRVSVCQRAIRLREAFIFYPLPTEDSLWFLHIGKGQTFQEMTFAMRGNVKPFGKRLSPSGGRLKLSCNDIYKNSQILQTQKVIYGSFGILLYYNFNMENNYSKGTALNPLRRPALLLVEN